MLGRLFEDFEQRVGRFFHESRGSEDGEGAACFDRGAVVGGMNHLANLAELDEQLRRIRRDDEHVGVGLDEDAGFALVGVAHVFAGGDGLGDQRFQVGGGPDAGAVLADAAEVGQAVGGGGVQAVDGFGKHEGERVLARALGAGEDERLRKTLGGYTLAEAGDGGRVAEKLLEAHTLSLVHLRVASQRAGDSAKPGAEKPGFEEM